MSAVPDVTDETFQAEVLQSDKPVLVDFWAPWCGPCRQVAPIVEQIAEDHKDQLKVVKLNIDENQKTPPAYQVTSIPTLNVFRGGQLAKSIVGARPKPVLESELAEFFA
jgi:thioredoxin 1